MIDVYDNCPVLQDDRFLLRLVTAEDLDDLLSVYSDKQALPFFNSDNCHGDNFYYPDEGRMKQAIEFWLSSYQNRYFVRWSIIDKETDKAIGSVELFHRVADDAFNHTGVLRLDLKSEYEMADYIVKILKIIVIPAYDLFDCEEVITKVPVYAIERIKAAEQAGFEKTDRLLIGTIDGYAYKDYWTRRKRN